VTEERTSRYSVGRGYHNLWRPLTLCILLIASAWIALVNGQPLFYFDTTSYVRGPDYAVVHLLGSNFASSWTQDGQLEHPRESTAGESQTPANRTGSLSSPSEQAVLSGRSIYYGALLYLGHLTSYFWLTVFAQAAVLLYLAYILIVTCLRLSFWTFSWTITIILLATPVSFFISYLMPDIFASYLILATIILAVFWDRLAIRHQVITSLIILFSILAHTSHILLMAGLIGVFVCLVLFLEGEPILSGSFTKRILILLALNLLGILGEVAFSQATRLVIGAQPIRPPFLMARVIEDGPGYRFLQENCIKRSYVVCNYIERMPIAAINFLWSTDPKKGVFAVEGPGIRRALSDEQFPFVLDVIRFDPIGQTTSSIQNAIRQLTTVGLSEFMFDKWQLQLYKNKLPVDYFSEMMSARIIFNHQILMSSEVWFRFVYGLSLGGLLLVWLVWPFIQSQLVVSGLQSVRWYQVISMAIIGVVLNAVICGALSDAQQRYQTRVSWIPLFILLLSATMLILQHGSVWFRWHRSSQRAV